MKLPVMRVALWLLLLLGIAWGLRAPFLHRTQWNLDEGSTFTMAQQVVDGAVLYRDAADNRGPLVPYLKAVVFAVAGDWNVYAVHLLLALAMGWAAFLLWDLCRKLGQSATGVAAALVFTVLTFLLPGTDDSLAAHTEWFVILFSTLGFWLFSRTYSSGRILPGVAIGLAFGASALCKQPGLLDLGVIWVLLAVLAYHEPARRMDYVRVWFGTCIGFAAAASLTIAYFWANGALSDFVYYSWTYNATLYVQEIPWFERLAGGRLVFDLARHNAPAIGLLAIGGVGLAAARLLRWRRDDGPGILVVPCLILGWTASGIASTMLSGRDFPHYAIQAIPGMSLAAGWTLAAGLKWIRAVPRPRWARYAFATGVAGAVAWSSLDLAHAWRTTVRTDDVNEAKLFELVKQHSSPAERLFVWGYYPNIYLMAERLPSSRYLYTNYVTGLIPWTNVDPLIDTRYAVAPHARERLQEDLSRTPPALIVDTLSTRGYLKYPLNEEPLLWQQIIEHYAQVSVEDPEAMRLRLFRRLASDRAPFPATATVDPAIVVSGHSSSAMNEPASVRVTAPPGAERIELFSGTMSLGAVAYPSARDVNVLFFMESSSAHHPMRAVISAAGTRTVSEPFDFAGYLEADASKPVSGPRLLQEGNVSPPSSVNTPWGPIESVIPGTWRVFAPAEIEYDCPSTVEKISFAHQLVDPAQMLSDGYDLLVELVENNGNITRLLQQRLDPIGTGKDQVRQYVRLTLPVGHQGGRLMVRFLNGKLNNSNADRIDITDIRTKDSGPALRLGEENLPPQFAEAAGHQAMEEQAAGRWSANTPARVEWERPLSAGSITLNYGILEGAYTAKEGHSDGVEFTLAIVDEAGKTHPLFDQLLTPFHRPEHRGEQSARIELPSGLRGRLVFAATPGPQNDHTWDWAWVGPIVAHPAAPVP
jgi:hypothetical protein